jgi:hypothetical protein
LIGWLNAKRSFGLGLFLLGLAVGTFGVFFALNVHYYYTYDVGTGTEFVIPAMIIALIFGAPGGVLFAKGWAVD